MVAAGVLIDRRRAAELAPDDDAHILVEAALVKVFDQRADGLVEQWQVGAGVLEIVEDFQANAYRAVYTVKFSGLVYVLHAFQKKSKRGIATPKTDVDLIKNRLRLAEQDYKKRSERRGHNR